MVKNEVCCWNCGCNIFRIKFSTKKPNKNKEYKAYFKCILCERRLRLPKKIKWVRIIMINYKK